MVLLMSDKKIKSEALKTLIEIKENLKKEIEKAKEIMYT